MSTQGFDASQVKRSTWIAGGGALVLWISTFLPWWKSSIVSSVHLSGWHTGALGKLVFFVALIALALVVVDFLKIEIPQLPWPISLLLLGAGALSLLLVIIRFIDTPDGASRAWGLYVAILAAAALTYGGWLKLQEG
jgi:small-conductance mechanosensitive channel